MKQKTILPFFKIIRSILFFPIGFYRYYKGQQLNTFKKNFADTLSFFKAKNGSKETNGIVLVQMVKDYENIIKFAAASKVIAEENNLEVSFYDVDWTAEIGWASKYKKYYDFFFTSGLEKIYKHFGKGMLHSYEDKYYDQSFIQQKLKNITKELVTPQDILSLKFENIVVGDLIYDTYLRYFHQPTIEKINTDVLLVIEIALNVFYNFTHFLNSSKKVNVLINVYSSYIDHGISARICLENNIDVYTIGSYNYIIQKLKKEFPYHQINHTLFSPDKKLSSGQLALARQKLTSRFEGKIDAATSYMRASAYSDKPVNAALKKLFAEQPRNIVIYVHDFYDSPHVNRMLQFPDLYQFLKQTLVAIKDIKGTNVFIKTHPNGLKGCKEKTIELVSGFNKDYFHIIDESVSNLNIIELKPDLIATARGTVCLEMAYFKIPTVALFDNLYTNFSFTHTCTDKQAYFSILNGEEKPENDFNEEKIFSFYYQAFLEKTIQDENNIFNILATFKGDTYNDNYLKFLLSGEYPKSQKSLINYYFRAVNEC